MSNNLLRKPRSMDHLLPPNYGSDEGQFDLNLPRIRPAWLMNESIKSLDSKFPMVPAPTGSIVFYTTPLGEKLCQQPKNKEFDLTDPLRPSLSYNYLHDEHLQTYLKSNDMRKRLQDEGFITDDGYVKCSLKEFNQYRQWIRKLKLDELNRERRQDEKKIVEARKERLERIALERDPELLEILKRRREKKREEAKIHEARIKKEQERLRKLEEIDRQRREKFVEMRRKTRDRIQIRRDLERERLRIRKCDEKRQEHKIKLRIVRKMNKDNESRMKHLEERKKEAKELKVKKREEQWLRRESWSVEHHERLKETKELQAREFQHHVEERNLKVARQRRWSQVSYNEIAEANRRAFESQLEKAEVFLAKLNNKKAEELKKWRKKFDAMQKSSHSSLGSKHSLIKKIKQRTRRESTWDLESCLLKDLGMAEDEIKDNSYTKLGVISRTNEEGLLGDTVGPLGSLPEEHNEGETPNKEFRFSIPTIVESLASIRESSSDESDSDSEYSFHIPSVFRFESLHDLQPVSDSPEIRPNDHIPEGEMRTLVNGYVQGILRQSADKLGVQMRFQERTPREQIPRITDVKRIPKLKAKEIEAGGANMRVKVKEYLTGILDKVEDKMQVTIERPPEYEKIKQEKQSTSQLPRETFIEEVIDNKLHYHSKRNVVRLYVCKIVEDAAEQCQINVKFPPQYQSFVKRLHKPRKKKVPTDNRNSKTADQHSIVLRAIASGTVVLESADKQRSMVITSDIIAKELGRMAHGIDEMTNKYDRVRAERWFHENLVMIATRTVIQALNIAVMVVCAQRRNSDFFMCDMPNLYLDNAPQTSPKEGAVLLKRQLSKYRRESIKADGVEQVPREVDFLRKISDKKSCGSEGKKGGKHISFQSTSRVSKQNEKRVSKADKSRKKNALETAAVKTGKGAETKKGDEKMKGKKAEASGKVRTGPNAQVNDVNDITESEPRIKVTEADKSPEKDAKNTGDEPKEDQLSEVKGTAISESNLGDNLGDDEIQAPLSTLSMKSPSLPQVTPQPSGFGLPSDSVRSGAVPPYTETTCDTERLAAGSPSSAIIRMINMRETRETCDLSPEASYVVLPTLTSSEGALISTRIEQMFNNVETKSKGLESTPSLPALSRSPSKETHSDANAPADYVNEPVKLPSVTSVESCPSRSPTPVRSSPIQSSCQVALPQIEGSNTSLVGANDSTEAKPEPRTENTSGGSGEKTPPTVSTPPKATAAKAPSPSKNPPGQKLSQGRPPARVKSEISRRPVATPAITPRKGGKAHSTTFIAAQKGATPSPPTQPRKPVELRKSVHATTPQDRLAKSKSTGEAIVAARRNSVGSSQTMRTTSEATVRRGSIASATKSKTSTNSNVSVKATLPKTDSSSQPQKRKTDASQKSDTSNVPAANLPKPTSPKSPQDIKTKPTPDVHAKTTQKKDTKSTQGTKSTQDPQSTQDNQATAQDNHTKSTNQAETTQNSNSKTASNGTPKNIRKGKGRRKKTAEKDKPDNNDHKDETQTEKDEDSQETNLTEELAKESTSLPDETTPGTEVPEITSEVETSSKTSVYQKDAMIYSTESISATKFSPGLTPESSPIPKAVSPLSEEEFIEKPQAMVGAIVTSPDLQELTRVDSPKERRRANSISRKILNTTESETEFFRREHDCRKLENQRDDMLVDEFLEQENSGKRRHCVSGLKPTIPKRKKKNMKQDWNDDEDEMKTTTGRAKIDDGTMEVSDRKTKVLDDTKNAVSKEAGNVNSSTSMYGARKDSLNEDMKTGKRSSSNTSSMQSLSNSSQSKISKSRRSSRSVSFSNTTLPDAQKQDEKNESAEHLTKRRSSQKIAKKASNKDLKRRRSSLSSQHAKGKNKPTAVTARVDSRRKASKTGLSKSHAKTREKSSNDTDVVSKLKSEETANPKDTLQEAHLKDSLETSKEDSQGTRVNDTQKIGLESRQKIGLESRQKIGLESRQETCVDDSRDTGVDHSRETRNVDGFPEISVDQSKKSRVNNLQAASVDESPETRVHDSQETNVDESQETRVHDSQETNVDESQEIGVHDAQKTREQDSQETHAHDSQEIQAEELQKTSGKESQKAHEQDLQEAGVKDSKGARDGSDDNLKKSESDEEVVVQVYVPDEAKMHGSNHVRKQISPESRKKTSNARTAAGGKEIRAQVAKEPPTVTRIDLQFGLESPEVKKTSSRRTFDINEKSLINIVPRNSLDMIKGTRIDPSENIKGFSSRSFHSKTKIPRAPNVPKGPGQGLRKNASDSKALKLASFELSNATGQAGVNLKTAGPNKAQMSAHRLASKMSTNLEKVDEGSALETSPLPSEKTTNLTTALNISKAGVTPKLDNESAVDSQTENQEDKPDNRNDKVEEGGEKDTNEKTEPTSNKSLHLLMQASNVCMNPASFADVVQGTPLLNKESSTGNDDVIGYTSSASIKSNSSQPLVPSPPITSKPDIVSPRISRMMSRKISNGSSKSRGSHGSANEMSPTASMEIVKLASHSSHGWVSSPTSSVKFLPPIDARASKASNASDDSSTKKRPRTAESVSRSGSVESKTSSGSRTKAAVVEVRRSGSGDLRIDGSSSALIGVKSSSSTGSPKQTVVGF